MAWQDEQLSHGADHQSWKSSEPAATGHQCPAPHGKEFCACLLAGPNLQQHTFKRQQLSPTTSLLVATSMRPAAQCQGSYAQASAQMALMSRQNYARWHSYELHISAANHASVRACNLRADARPANCRSCLCPGCQTAPACL